MTATTKDDYQNPVGLMIEEDQSEAGNHLSAPRVLLINPPLTGLVKKELFLTEPLGLGYLASAVNDICNVFILDCFILGYENLVQKDGVYRKGLEESEILLRIKEFEPDVVGITSNFTAFANNSMRMAELAKQAVPDCYIVMGGAHASMDHLDVIKDPSVDCVVRGEGEETFREMILELKKGKDINSTSGTTVKVNGKVLTNPERALIENLDTIRFPQRDKMYFDLYLKYSSDNYPYSMRQPVASMATTRGCPYECTFCSTIQMWTRNWRKVSIDRVVEEIEDLQKNYGVREIAFYDDAFLIDRKRVLGICEEIIKRKLDIKFTIPPGINVINLDEELIIKMKQAGLYRVTLPIETGNKETQKFIKKPIDLDHARKMIDVCNRKGIWSQANFVVGFLYETQSQVDETLEYSYSLNLDYIFYYVAQPYAGSELYEIYEEQNLLDGKYDSMSTMWDTKYETKHFKPEDLRKITDEAMKKHFKIRVLSYLNPIYFFQFLWPKIKTWEQFKFFLGIVFNREKVKNIIINQ